MFATADHQPESYLQKMTTHYLDILTQIEAIDPVAYAKTRNFTDGAVTRLSPYISRGVISGRQIISSLQQRGFQPPEMMTLLRELSWREYNQRVWQARGADIDFDLKSEQEGVCEYGLPAAVLQHQTGIQALDSAIEELYATGYMHNHVRMYVASVVCNIAHCHWKIPAQWLYYHLHDADWASNALSWQWIAGCFSNKKYFANQENINLFTRTKQHETFLDVSYEELPALKVPEILQHMTKPALHTVLPASHEISLRVELPVYIYNFYNLDPAWDCDVNANRILLLEPDFFEKYSVSEHTMRFVLQLSENIKSLQVFVGSFSELRKLAGAETVFYYKEHPSNVHYQGTEVPRDWIFPQVTGYFSSFSKYWKQCLKHLTTI